MFEARFVSDATLEWVRVPEGEPGPPPKLGLTAAQQAMIIDVVSKIGMGFIPRPLRVNHDDALQRGDPSARPVWALKTVGVPKFVHWTAFKSERTEPFEDFLEVTPRLVDWAKLARSWLRCVGELSEKRFEWLLSAWSSKALERVARRPKQKSRVLVCFRHDHPRVMETRTNPVLVDLKRAGRLVTLQAFADSLFSKEYEHGESDGYRTSNEVETITGGKIVPRGTLEPFLDKIALGDLFEVGDRDEDCTLIERVADWYLVNKSRIEAVRFPLNPFIFSIPY